MCNCNEASHVSPTPPAYSNPSGCIQSAVDAAVDVCCGLGATSPRLTELVLQSSGAVDGSGSVVGSMSGGGRGLVGTNGVDVGVGGACQKGPWPGWAGWGGAPSPLPQLLSELVVAVGREDAITNGFRRFLFKQVRKEKYNTV